MSTIVTTAPACKNASAKAAPIPPVPPVISTCLPFTLKSTLMNLAPHRFAGFCATLGCSCRVPGASRGLTILAFSGGRERERSARRARPSATAG